MMPICQRLSTAFCYRVPWRRLGIQVQTKTNRICQRSFSTSSEAHAAVKSPFKKSVLIAGATLGSLALCLSFQTTESEAKATRTPGGAFEEAGKDNPALPNFTKHVIAKHNTVENRIWVIYKDGVYDITEFIEEHPGGKTRIMLAAGGSIEPFWGLYQQHASDEVAEILETLRIGNVDPSDRAKQGAKDPNDPYSTDPERHPALIARMAKPFNAETPPILLAEKQVTPSELFYVRNHLPVPQVNPKDYVLEISIEGHPKTLKLTLDDLKTKFPKVEVEAAIQCAGNRRTALNQVKEVRGLAWDIGAIGNAKWGGVRLRDVLKAAGYDVDSPEMINNLPHIHFEGLDKDFEKSYTASIPSAKASAWNGDCVIAFEMNGEEIPRDHGYPVRAIVPGTVGARNVKWLHKIKASSKENDGHWQQNDYKGFSPNVDWNNVDYKNSPAIQDLPVQSAITSHLRGAILEPGTNEVSVRGYAWAGGGRGIVRVDVSGDGGKSWTTANLERPDQPLDRTWAWTLWDANVPVSPDDSGYAEIVCKAVDSGYNVQPDTTAPIWNVRGVLSTAWHRIPVKVPKESL